MNMSKPAIEVPCLDCGALRSVKTNGMLLESYLKRSPVCRSCGAKRVADKISKGWFKKGFTPWNKGKKGLSVAWNKGDKGMKPWMNLKGLELGRGWNRGLHFLQDEKHPHWKGDEVGYSALHSWVKRKLGKADMCKICGTKESKRYEWANISGEYKRDLNDWIKVCTKCHHKMDKISERGNETKRRNKWLTA